MSSSFLEISDNRVMLSCSSFTVEYIEYEPIIKIANRVLFPSLRQSDRMSILLNGKDVGVAEKRYGIIPHSFFYNKAFQSDSILYRLIASKFGVMLNEDYTSYLKVNILGKEYILVIVSADADNVIVHIFDDFYNGAVGRLSFDVNNQSFYLHSIDSKRHKTISCALAYGAYHAVKQFSSMVFHRQYYLLS